MIELPIPEFVGICLLLLLGGYLVGLWLGERTAPRYYPLSLRARIKTFFWRWTL